MIKRLADDVALGSLGRLAVRLEHQVGGLTQIRAGLLERTALGIGARQFLHESDEAFRHFLIYGRELQELEVQRCHEQVQRHSTS